MFIRSRPLAFFTSVAALLVFASCNPNTSGPSMVTVIQLGSPPPDTTNNAIDLNAADVTKSNIPAGTAIRLLATITAPANAPITGITVTSNLTYVCSFGHSEGQGSLQSIPLVFTPPIPTAPNSTSVRVDSVADPVAMIPCPTNKPGAGAINIQGNVRISATNSAGTSTSKSLIFDYANIGSP